MLYTPDEFPKETFIHIRRTDNRALIGLTYNHHRMTALRYDVPPLESVSTDFEHFGTRILEALDGCELKGDFNYHDRTPADSPLYKVSGCATPRRFDLEYAALALRGANEKNLIWTCDFCLDPQATRILSSSKSSSAKPAELGKWIHTFAQEGILLEGTLARERKRARTGA